MVAPNQFSELGFQEIKCAPFEKADKGFTLVARRFHTQAVIYKGLTALMKRFFVEANKYQSKLVIALAEPYSITAFFIWISSKLALGKDFKVVLYAAQNINKPFRPPLKWIQSLMYKRADAIFSIGPTQSKVLRDSGYKGKIIPFPLWYDSSLFKPSSQTKSFKGGAVEIGFVGALNSQKGLEDLVSALEESEELQKRTRLSVVGKGELSDMISPRVQALGGRMLGFLPHESMPEFYQNIHILIVPSRTMPNIKEQFARVIIEAWACGTPVMGTRSGEITTLIKDERLLFDERNPASLSECLLTFIHAPEAHHESQILKQASSFSDKACAQEIQHHLSNLIQNKEAKKH